MTDGDLDMIEFRDFESFPPSPYAEGLQALHARIFVGHNPAMIATELANRPRCFVTIALEDDEVVGYKIGYEERRDRFYSWLGGVAPEFRRHGIGSALMMRQHDWCRSQGYRCIRTHTKNKWRDMLILNLRHGFDIIGTYTDSRGEPKIILEKRL